MVYFRKKRYSRKKTTRKPKRKGKALPGLPPNRFISYAKKYGKKAYNFYRTHHRGVNYLLWKTAKTLGKSIPSGRVRRSLDNAIDIYYNPKNYWNYAKLAAGLLLPD